MSAPLLECRNLGVAYGAVTVLRSLDLEVGVGESVAILGPSGSGKTSLFAAVAGFLAPTSGEIRLEGRTVSTAQHVESPDRRRLAMVFQHAALWPHLSALDTVAYPMRRVGVDATTARRRAAELLERVGIGQLAERRPAELSGGEGQRVGIARALARGARLLLLDEPTAHLDAPLRAGLLGELAELQRGSGAAALWATHDTSEAMAVADRVGVLGEGRLRQVGTPRDLHERPADRETAMLSGPASMLELNDVQLRGAHSTARVGGRRISLALAAAGPVAAGRALAIVRPDWAGLGGELEGIVRAVWYRGAHTDQELLTDAGMLMLRNPGPPAAAPGDRITWHLDRAWLP